MEFNVCGMVFVFYMEIVWKEGFWIDIFCGEDGFLVLVLKKYGKLRFVIVCKVCVFIGYGIILVDGFLFSSFKKWVIKGLRSFMVFFYSKNNYEDEDFNLIK